MHQNTSTSTNSTGVPETTDKHKTILMAMYNLKGGVGKTTSTLEFAFHLALDGFRVLLIDGDMQANLTSSILDDQTQASDEVTSANPDATAVVAGNSGSTSEDSEEEEDLSNSDIDNDSDDEKGNKKKRKMIIDPCDRLWKQIKKAEKDEGVFQMFHTIVKQFTGDHPHQPKSGPDSVIPKIRPLKSGVEGIDYIAGHMDIDELQEDIGEGFRRKGGYPIPGLVTNLFREFAEQKRYDVVIFDLGCSMTASVKAVLLGVDYIISPFKAESACRNAAESVMKKLRDWHNINNKQNVIKIHNYYGVKGDGRVFQDYVSPQLKCWPKFLGAFPVALKVINGQAKKRDKRLAKAYAKKTRQIFARYQHDIYSDIKGTGFDFVKLEKPDLTRLKKRYIENSESAGLEATDTTKYGYGYGSVSRFYVTNKGTTNRNLKGLVEKAEKIFNEYQKVIQALFANMREKDRAYLAQKSKKLLKGLVQPDVVADSDTDQDISPAATPKSKKRKGAASDVARTDRHTSLVSPERILRSKTKTARDQREAATNQFSIDQYRLSINPDCVAKIAKEDHGYALIHSPIGRGSWLSAIRLAYTVLNGAIDRPTDPLEPDPFSSPDSFIAFVRYQDKKLSGEDINKDDPTNKKEKRLIKNILSPNNSGVESEHFEASLKYLSFHFNLALKVYAYYHNEKVFKPETYAKLIYNPYEAGMEPDATIFLVHWESFDGTLEHYDALIIDPTSENITEINRLNDQTAADQKAQEQTALFEQVIETWSHPYHEGDSGVRAAMAQSKADFMAGPQAGAFKSRVEGYGLKLQGVPGDGNCFFHAVAHQIQTRKLNLPALEGSILDHAALRTLAVQELIALNERGELQDFTNDPNGLITRAATDREWADDFVISTLARALNITIMIVASDKNQPYSIHDGTADTIYLAYHAGLHFDSLTGNPSAELLNRVHPPAARRASSTAMMTTTVDMATKSPHRKHRRNSQDTVSDNDD